MRFVLIGCLLLSAGGCTNSFARVADTIAAAPDWYEARRKEVRGEGYPDISRIPTLSVGEARGLDLDDVRADIEVIEALFRADPRAVPPGMELEEMRAWANQAIAEANALAEPGDLLTDEEAEDLRGLFEVGRAQG